MKKNFLKLIENEQIAELSAQVFNQKLSESGNGTYTEVLSEDEETAFMDKLLSKDGLEAEPWLKFLNDYSEHYPVCNQAIDLLLNSLDKSQAMPLLVTLLNKYSYNEQQGLKVCDIVLKGNSYKENLDLLQTMTGCGRFFSDEIYKRLEVVDARIRDAGYAEQAVFAESYRQAVENYKNNHV